MLYKLLLVIIGGFIGGMTRYGAYLGIKAFLPEDHYPIETLIVNITGCFLMGLIFYPTGSPKDKKPLVHALFCTGFLGAYTTYSSFGLDVFEHFLTATPIYLVYDILLEVALGVIFLNLGAILKHRLAR